MVFNPSLMDRLFHTVCGAWIVPLSSIGSSAAGLGLAKRATENTVENGFIQRGGLWVVTQGVLLVVVLLLGLSHRIGAIDAPLRILSLLSLALSALCGLAGLIALGRNLTPLPRPAAAAKLVQSGIYKFMRHPLYVSVVLGSFGWSLFRQSWPAMLMSVIITGFLDAKARHEEAWLRQQFAEYVDYERRVCRFVPWIY